MTENNASQARDALEALATLIDLKLTHMVAGIDALRDQGRAQELAEAKRLQIYEEKWQDDHDTMTGLVAALGYVQASLERWVKQFQKQLDRIDSVQRESRRTDALIAAITAVAMAAIVVFAK